MGNIIHYRSEDRGCDSDNPWNHEGEVELDNTIKFNSVPTIPTIDEKFEKELNKLKDDINIDTSWAVLKFNIIDLEYLLYLKEIYDETKSKTLKRIIENMNLLKLIHEYRSSIPGKDMSYYNFKKFLEWTYGDDIR